MTIKGILFVFSRSINIKTNSRIQAASVNLQVVWSVSFFFTKVCVSKSNKYVAVIIAVVIKINNSSFSVYVIHLFYILVQVP